MKRRLRIASSVLAMMLLLSSCGSAGTTSASTTTAPAATTAAATDTPAPAATDATATTAAATDATATTAAASASTAAYSKPEGAAPDFLDAATPDHPYWLSKDKVTLSVFIGAVNSQTVQDWNQSDIFKAMEDATNVHLDFKSPSTADSNDFTQAYNLLIASGDLPDMLFSPPVYIGGTDKAIADKMYADISDQVPLYAPDYNKVLNSDPEIRRECLTDAGKVDGISEIQLSEEPPWQGMWVRKDILDELGLQMPKTIDDWNKMLQTVKEKKPDMTPQLSAITNDYTSSSFAGAFDTVTRNFYERDGKVTYSMLDPQYKDFITYLQNWYKQGYMYKDAFADAADTSGTANTREMADISAGKVFAFDRAYGDIGPLLAAGQKTNPNFQLAAAPMPSNANGDKPKIRQYNSFKKGPKIYFGANSKNIKIGLEWSNYSYTDKGFLLANYGIEGKTFTMQPANGDFGIDGPFLPASIKATGNKPVFTDFMVKNPDGQDFWALIPQYKLHEVYGILRNPLSYPMSAPVIDCMKVWQESATHEYGLPPIVETADEAKQDANIMTPLNTYTDEQIAKFVTGQNDMSKWDAFVTQIKSMGVDTMVTIKQGDLDRYMSK